MAHTGIHTGYHRHGNSYWRVTSSETSHTTAGDPQSLIINVRLEPVPWRRYWWESLKRRLRSR